MSINQDLHPDDTAHRRDLVAQLRRIRIDAGLRFVDLAPPLYVQPATLSNFETRQTHSSKIAIVQRHARSVGHVAELVLHGLTWQITADMRTYAAVAATAADSDVADEAARSLCIARLTAARRHQHLTRFAAAKRLGVNDNTLLQIETEEYEPMLSTYQRYARALGGRLTVELRPIEALERVEAAA